MVEKIKKGLDKENIKTFYSKKEVAEAIVNLCSQREVGVMYEGGRYGKRPDILQYPQDVIELANKGALSFHISEERWNNPLELQPGMRTIELDNNRIGWDLIIDIDCKIFEISKIATEVIINALKYYEVPLTVKFSGGSGFHIGIVWEVLPKTINQKDTSILFPDIPRAVANYLKKMIEEPFIIKLLEIFSIDEIVNMSGKPFEQLVQNNKLNPWSLIEIDNVALSSRHLIRCIYSINEKSGLVSIPLLPAEIKDFTLEDARMENVNVDDDIKKKRIFLNRDIIIKENNINNLFLQSIDYTRKEKIDIEEKESQKEYEDLEEAAPEELFPPCIKLILAGIKDGRKRATFILVNFLRSVGWSYDMIEVRLKEWNKVLEDPLNEQDLFGSLRYHKNKKSKVLPPNCDNQGYYLDIGVCKPDNLCKKIKNPVSYVRVKVHSAKENMKESKKDNNKVTKKVIKEIVREEKN